MENTTNYIDRALISLRRIYTKDETIQALTKKLKEAEIELGKSISYIYELEHENQLLKNSDGKLLENYKKLEKKLNDISLDAKKDELYIMRSEENSRLNSELKKLRKKNKELVLIICNLKKSKL